MNTRSVLIACLPVAMMLLAQPAVGQSVASERMKSGLWEFTIQTVEPNAAPPMTSVICVSKAMAKELVTPPQTKPRDACQVSVVPSRSDESVYSVNCASLKRSSSSKFTFFGDRYEGTVTIDLNGIAIKQTHTARRLGPCDETRNGPAGPEE